MFKRLIDQLRGQTHVEGDAARGEGELLDAFVTEARALDDFWIANYLRVPAAQTITAGPPDARLRMVVVTLERLRDKQRALARKPYMSSSDMDHETAHVLKELLSNLLRARLPFDEQSLAKLLNAAAVGSHWVPVPPGGVLRVVERYAEEHPLATEHRELLQKLKVRLDKADTAEQRKLGQRIDALLAAKHGGAVAREVELVAGDPWSDAMTASMAAADAPTRDGWQRVMNHAVTARGAKPSAKWVKTVGTIIDGGIGRERFVAGLSTWLPLVGKPGRGNPMRGYMQPHPEPTVLNEHNADLLKGIVWSTAALDDTTLARLLGDVAEVCFKKIPVHGARCPKVANACLAALALMKGPEPVAQLSRIQAKAKKPSAQKLIEKAMARSAEQQGVSPEELEEMSVPDFGLDLSGRRAIPVGEWTAEIEVTERRDVELRWRKAGAAKPQGAVPAEVKRDHADALKDVKRLVKDVERILPTQVARIERLLLDDRSWAIDVWRTRYLDHSLIAPFARRLIWQLDGDPPRTFVHRGDGFADANDRLVELKLGAQVRLWHPIDSPPDDVLAWRRWLESHGVTQPFKQAHREVYVLTDAERQTRTYSNRFAGHILRQHQFHALCGARGWAYHLQGGFDSHNIPTRMLRRQGMRVEFWVDPVDTRESDAGIFLHVSTDQVRFYGGESEQEPMPLDRVAPHVLSELMRDVDLFVGVCSVGNDPTWRDRGEQFGDYWQSFTFGELGESAKTRRDVLSRLLPRLKIADRATLSDKFLVVRGHLRTYKIHLGSSNIQMEPNNQYLCIVPDRKNVGEDVFLPFEGDHTLAVILSKAFMLARDWEIKDSSIVSQIRVHR